MVGRKVRSVGCGSSAALSGVALEGFFGDLDSLQGLVFVPQGFLVVLILDQAFPGFAQRLVLPGWDGAEPELAEDGDGDGLGLLRPGLWPATVLLAGKLSSPRIAPEE